VRGFAPSIPTPSQPDFAWSARSTRSLSPYFLLAKCLLSAARNKPFQYVTDKNLVAAGQFQRANIKVLILCRAHFVSLPAGAFGVAKECHPSAPSRREPHQNENAKHQKEKLIAGAGRGKKVGPQAPLKTTGRWHGYKNANHGVFATI